MDEARARVYLGAAERPTAEWRFVREFAPDPGDADADGITVSFGPGLDSFGAQVARWSFKDAVKSAWPIDDPTARQVISRHWKSVDPSASVPTGSVLLQRFVIYATGSFSRFDNAPWDVRDPPTQAHKDAWKTLAKDFAGRGPGSYECLGQLASFGEWVLVHPGPYPDTIEVAAFTTNPASVRALSWDTRERRLYHSLATKTSDELARKLDDAALLEVLSFGAPAWGKEPPPNEELQLRKHEVLFPARVGG